MKEAFAAADEDSSTGLSEEELAKAMEKWYGHYHHYHYYHHPFHYLAEKGTDQASTGEAEKDNGSAALLRDVDANGDGEAQLEEVVSFLSRVRSAGSEQEMKEAFAAADEDSSAGLSEEELAKAMEKWYGHYHHYHYYHHPFHYLAEKEGDQDKWYGHY